MLGEAKKRYVRLVWSKVSNSPPGPWVVHDANPTKGVDYDDTESHALSIVSRADS